MDHGVAWSATRRRNAPCPGSSSCWWSAWYYHDSSEALTDADGRFEIPRRSLWSLTGKELRFSYFKFGYVKWGHGGDGNKGDARATDSLRTWSIGDLIVLSPPSPQQVSVAATKREARTVNDFRDLHSNGGG